MVITRRLQEVSSLDLDAVSRAQFVCRKTSNSRLKQEVLETSNSLLKQEGSGSIAHEITTIRSSVVEVVEIGTFHIGSGILDGVVNS